MMKLLRSDFARLHTLFWIGIAVSAALGVICPTLSEWLNYKLVVFTDGMIGHISDGYDSLDYYFFTWVLFIVFFFALFCSCYTGTEYSDGTLRNKITAGHSRTDIYLSYFMTNAAVGCIYYTVYMAVGLCVGIPFLGKFEVFDKSEVVTYILCVYVIMIAFAGIFTMIAMLVSNKSIAVVLCICVIVILLLIPTYQTGNLQWKEYWEDDWTYAGVTYLAGTKCPYYIGGIRRALSVFLVDFLPGGPLLQFYSFSWLVFSDNIYLNPYVIFCGAAFFAVVPTVTGLRLFWKKDLK